jgi:hypothetical protein
VKPHEEARIHLNYSDFDGEVHWACPQGCGWGYTTFTAHMTAQRLPRAKVRRGPHAWETARLAWFPAEVVGQLDLHPGFRAAWPQLRRLLPR